MTDRNCDWSCSWGRIVGKGQRGKGKVLKFDDVLLYACHHQYNDRCSFMWKLSTRNRSTFVGAGSRVLSEGIAFIRNKDFETSGS